MRFGDLGIRQPLDHLHGRCRAGRPAQRPSQEQSALAFRIVEGGAHPGAEQAVAAAQMMVQETERGAHREGVQPQRDLGQFHRHRVLVHAVHAALEHHAPDDVPVVELRRIESPAAILGIGHDRVADPVDALRQR